MYYQRSSNGNCERNERKKWRHMLELWVVSTVIETKQERELRALDSGLTPDKSRTGRARIHWAGNDSEKPYTCQP